MLDNLREDANTGSFFDDEDSFDFTEFEEQPAAPKKPLLGMTAAQRFALAVMLLLSTCMLGSFCLLITEKIVPAFLY